MAPINGLIQTIKTLIAGAEEIPDDTCVACESKNVTALAQGVYRCDDCGYEGGSGYAAWQQSQRDAKLLALAPERRKELAREKLEQALRLLLSADGDADAGHHEGFSDLNALDVMEAVGVDIGLSSDIDVDEYRTTDGDYQQQVGAERQIMEAAELANDAFVLLYGERENPATPEAPGYVASFMQLRLDHSMGDVGLMARRLGNKSEIRNLRQAIERTLAEAFA